MTENEAIEELEHSVVSYEVQNKNNITCDLTQNVLDMAIQALKEIQQYRAIGTIEETKDLKEKSVTRKIKGTRFKEAICPNCETELFETYWAFGGIHYCSNCGQKLDWQ